MPFSGALDPENSWVVFSPSTPWKDQNKHVPLGFGSGKRKDSLDLIKTRLSKGAEISISMGFLVMCAEKALRLLHLYLLLFLPGFMSAYSKHRLEAFSNILLLMITNSVSTIYLWT